MVLVLAPSNDPVPVLLVAAVVPNVNPELAAGFVPNNPPVLPSGAVLVLAPNRPPVLADVLVVPNSPPVELVAAPNNPVLADAVNIHGYDIRDY